MMLPKVETKSARGLDFRDDLWELRWRMERPQRHRLLHGYPLAAAIPRRRGAGPAEPLEFDPGRGLLLGVLPHSFCNPAVAGCGFCTFPHETFSSRKAAVVVEHVIREIDQRLGESPGLAGRAVSAVYFGGGTANLTPAGPFRDLCRALARSFDFTGAEVTLEGVPAAFLNREPLLVDILREELPARHFRLSMGVQTFNTARLEQMGRLGFGTPETFRSVVELGHSRGFTVSGDILFNLPGQESEEMEKDLESASEIGLDHLGLYHLVMFSGLGTEWSRDPKLIEALPSNSEGFWNWVELLVVLEELGFSQTTLTNFERRGFQGSDRRFVYEEFTFRPDVYDMIGFGPSAFSYAGSSASAVKVVNPEASAAYIEAIGRGGATWDRAYRYSPRDVRVHYLTRRIAALGIDRGAYFQYFGTDVLDDFLREVAALQREHLVELTDAAIRPTESGMFHADSIAGLLAWRRLDELGTGPSVARSSRSRFDRRNDNTRGHM